MGPNPTGARCTVPSGQSRFRPLVAIAALLLCLAFGEPAQAGPQIVVQGLFRDRAVVTIDGRQRLLRVGERSPEGVLLVSADSAAAVLEVDGRRATYRLGEQIAGTYAAPESSEVQIWPDTRGMYRTVGSINGLPVHFIVDTGATLIAMNEAEARRLGIDYRLNGERGYASTASGMALTHQVKLRSVKVGDIQLRDVDALVIDGAFPERVLLGMSFLGRLKIENQGAAMLLRQLH